MDLFKIIQNSYNEKSRIDKAIAVIEELATSAPPSGPGNSAPPATKRGRGRPRKPTQGGQPRPTS